MTASDPKRTSQNTRMSVIGRLYRWLYYRWYRYSVRADFKFSMHWANASLYMIMLLLLNLTVLLVVVGFLFHLALGIPMGLPHWIVGMAFVVVVLLHHAFLRVGGHYKRIIGEFSKETPEQQRHGDRLFGWYLVLSMLAFAATAIGAFIHLSPAS